MIHAYPVQRADRDVHCGVQSSFSYVALKPRDSVQIEKKNCMLVKIISSAHGYIWITFKSDNCVSFSLNTQFLSRYFNKESRPAPNYLQSIEQKKHQYLSVNWWICLEKVDLSFILPTLWLRVETHTVLYISGAVNRQFTNISARNCQRSPCRWYSTSRWVSCSG